MDKTDTLLVLNGNLLSKLQKNYIDEILNDIHLSEFKVFSQFGDDGIIQFLINYLKIVNETFVEFGVENYKEANTRFLLVNNNWKGLVIDGSSDNIKQIQNEDIYWKYDITAVHSFITKENINFILKNNGFIDEIGLLHIDIDGNDYWIWEEISCISPIIVIIEYNSVFGCEKPWTISYDKNFDRTNYHHSNLYFGASLLSLCDLAEKKGYYFIGCNSNGNNAYFIRKDKISGLKILNTKEGYVLSKFRESRDKAGKLTYISGEERLQLLKGMDVYNTKNGEIEKI